LHVDAIPLRAEARARPVAASRRGWRTAILAAGVFLVALAVLGWEARVAGFEADEADYTATSRYFGYLFLQRDPWRPEWDGNHWTRTQPPLTRYIVGGWLTVRGYDLEEMNQPYVSTASSFEVNRRKGRVPTDDVLAVARQPMVLLGAGAVALLFALGALLGGPLAGLVAAGLAMSSGFVRYTFVHAWAEAPLAFFLALSALLVALGADRLARGRPWRTWALAAGLALGLACATKLTGYVGLVMTLTLALGAAGLVWRRAGHVTSSGIPRAGGAPAAWIAWGAIVGLTALALSVALNPFLWRGPVAGVAEMVAQRRDEMAAQQVQWPEFAVLTWQERPGLTVLGTTRFGPWDERPWLAVPLNLLLLGAGGASLYDAWRRRAAPPGGWPAAIVLVGWLGAYLIAIVGGLGLSYPRYFLPGCLFLLPLAGAGAAWVVGRLRFRVASGAPAPARAVAE
jgi:hypothetical protein